jgi:hypothetical protein
VRNDAEGRDAWAGTLTSLALTLVFLGALLVVVLVGLYLLTDMFSFGGHVPKNFD